MLIEINDRCEKLQKKWELKNFDISQFPELVLELFDSFDFSYFSKLENLSGLIKDKNIAVLQEPSSFSDLYFKIFDNGYFWIEILNWWGMDINIHDHNFTGVQFQLLGESLNVVYKFKESLSLKNLSLGDFDVSRVELWKKGDYSIVRPGRSEPHNVIHLDIPTVSLLIRTYPRNELPSQNNYFPPLLRADYGIADKVFRKKLALLRLLAKGEKETFHEEFKRVYSLLEASERLFVTMKMVDILFHPNNIELIEYIAGYDKLSEIFSISAKFYMFSNFYSTSLKKIKTLEKEDYYTIAALACSYNETSLNRIIRDIKSMGFEINPKITLNKIAGMLNSTQLKIFESALMVLNLNLDVTFNEIV